MPDEPLELLNQFLLAFIAILPVVNPFSVPPIFLSITEGLTPDERRRQALKACTYAFVILIVSLLGGTLILRFFSISLPALQIAGGLLIARIAFEMLNPKREHHQTDAEEKESRAKQDISFVPLAMPLLSGPGSMAVMINLSTHTAFWADWIVIGAASLAVCVISYVVLVESLRLTNFLGVNGMNALSKLMGFLLLSLAIQFIINGVSAALTTLVHALNNDSSS
jgi:multiple antibiotic resistance protein